MQAKSDVNWLDARIAKRHLRVNRRLPHPLVMLLLIIPLATVCIRYQGIQYLAAYSGEGFAHEMPEFLIDSTITSTHCSSNAIDVLTFNVEYGSALIEALASRFNYHSTGGALPWSERLPEIRERIAGYAPDLIGLQETHSDTDIANIVSLDHYQLITYHLGNFHYGDAALLFKKAKFELLDSGQVWLSPHPELPMSFGFRPLAMVRYANWAMLREKSSGFAFMFVNTHFDNAKANKDPSATLFNQQITQLAKDIPIVVTGDFNSTANTERYRRFTGAYNSEPLLQNTYLLSDTRPVDALLHPNRRIDHILAGGPCKIKAHQWQIDQRALKNGKRMSDHEPILAQLKFTP